VRTAPVEPALIDWSGPVPSAPRFSDRYHPEAGAAAQAEHVFLRGNGLPERWRGRERFTIVETGFGLGHAFLAAWRAWRADPARCRRLFFVSVDLHPPTRADLERAFRAADARPDAQSAALVAAWPPLTPDLHLLEFEGGALRLLLAFGDANAWIPALRCHADAFFLDGFAPDRNAAMWRPELLAALGRRAAPGATAATWSAAREVRDGLGAAGFDVQRAPGIGGKRDITVARFAPRFAARVLPDPALDTAAPRRALVVGAGLAGAAVAGALAAAGLDVRVIERHAGAALEASGNPAALVHGVLAADDGPHARLLRAAALHAATRYAAKPGLARLNGLLWLDRRRGLSAMHELIATRGAPADYVQALDAEAAGALAGVPLAAPAWHYPRGGWIDPGAWVRDRLAALPLATGLDIARLEPGGPGWRLFGRDGHLVDEAPLVVLANAASARTLAPGLPALTASRGQVSWCRAPRGPLPRLPLTGDGYAIPLPEGGLLFGASRSPADTDTTLRDADLQHNLRRLRRLVGAGGPQVDASLCGGRAALRVTSADRLPVAGAVAVPGSRAAQRRRLERAPGLFVLSALGSRGATLAPLLGELVVAMACGAPWPLAQDLVDAIDPGRG
jgi:tRNA 5-methylaminomethyl-2-thiouridine biosynthesis bifunctional protein